MSLTKKDRSFQSKSGKVFPAESPAPAPQSAFADGVATLLRRAYGGRHSAVKVVAAAIGTNERAVKNWFEAKNGPSGEHVVRLMRHSDAMLDGFLAMAGKTDLAAAVEVRKAKRAVESALRELNKLDASRKAGRSETAPLDG